QVRVRVLVQIQGDLVWKAGLADPGSDDINRAVVLGAQQVGPRQSVHVVEDRQDSRTRDVARQLGGRLAVAAVHVLAGELLAHRHDAGQLDRGERLLTT